jgi:hypothetical protein
MADYLFTVTVSTEHYDEAEQVMRERVYHDEDYGFPYQIDFKPVPEEEVT